MSGPSFTKALRLERSSIIQFGHVTGSNTRTSAVAVAVELLTVPTIEVHSASDSSLVTFRPGCTALPAEPRGIHVVITAYEAHKFSEVIFLVLPILALANLVQSGDGPGLRIRRPGSAESPEGAPDADVRALVKAVIFYWGFVVSAALAMLGVLIKAPPQYLAVQFTLFNLTAYCLFSQVGDELLIDLMEIFTSAGGTALVEPGHRLARKDWRKVMSSFANLTHDVVTRADTDDKRKRRRRCISLASIVAVPALTLSFLLFVLCVDCVLLTSRVV